MQYVLQTRHDERRGKVTPGVVMRVVRLLADMPVTSLTDYDEHTWHQHGRSAVRDSRTRGFLSYAYRAVADLAEAGGWEAEYPRDIWQMRRLGFEGGRSLRFDVISQPWLRELAKRWTRWRLASGLGLEAASRPIRVITRFARFCDRAGIDAISEIDRQVLERYLADLHAEMAGSQRQGSHIGLLGGFFTAIRQHRWDTDLPTSAMFFTEDYPKRAERLPRALAEHVMAQLESIDNLNRWDNPTYRLVTVILMRCGLRVSDALRLPCDCVVTDADAAPYLRYFNHKMKRDALVPIDEELARPARPAASTQRRSLARGHVRPVSSAHQEPRRHRAHLQLDLPVGALSLAGPLRHPRRTRPPGHPHAPPVEAHPGHTPDQPRRPAGSRQSPT